MPVFYADSGALADWQAKEALMSDGDFLEIPDFNDAWTGYFETSKAINIVSANGPASCIIGFGRAGSSLHFVFNLNSANAVTSLVGFGFADGGSTGGGYGIATFGGGFGNPGYDQRTDSREFRLGYCKFDHLPTTFAAINTNDTLGVIDNSEFLLPPGYIGIYSFNRYWRDVAGNAGPYAGGSWSGPTEFGSRKFLFIETNIFTGDAPRASPVDSYGGARTVFRYNTCTRALHSTHGTETGGLPRGGRAFEIYNNAFTDSEDAVVDVRSGIVLMYGNTTTGTANPVATLDNDRTRYPYLPAPGATADGTSRYDINEPGGPFETGVATSGTLAGGTQGQPTMTMTGAGWTPNEWVGYSIVRTSGTPFTQVASYILENSADTITFLNAVDNPPVNTMVFEAGDDFEIYKVNEAIDSPGRALGSWIEDMSAGLPVGWNDQVTEACYSWNNTRTENGAQWGFSPGPYSGVIREGEHFINETQMPGYTAYEYPHPLRAGDPPESPMEAPEFTVDPVVTGTPEVGETLTTDDGTATGDPAPTFTYQWYRCTTP